jgi:quinol-cytochrome oxidoreductase complex cytochrome b subunit
LVFIQNSGRRSRAEKEKPGHELTDQPSLFYRIRDSVFPGMGKEQPAHRRLFNTLIFHFRPRNVPERTLRFSLTWGLGGMAFALVMILFGTGLLLKFAYQPFPDKAYESILRLQNEVTFGLLIRNIHHWSANLLVVIAFLHFLRVFLTGAFHSPRQFNWVIGLGLFIAAMLSNFTGYLLPWDQLAFWAVTICTGMLEYIPGVGTQLQHVIQGGTEVGPSTLSNFYAIHTAILPALFVILMPFHFWRVRKAGGLVIPRRPAEDALLRGETVPALPNLLLREVVVALVLMAFVAVFSVAFDAPLGSRANPGLSPNPTKAPWYFMGFQEILLHFHPTFALFVIPGLMVILLIALPYIRFEANTAGVWFASSKGRRMALVAVIVAGVATPVGVLLDEYLVDFTARVPGVVVNGVVPFGILLAVTAGFHILMKRVYSSTTNEAVQTVFVLFLVSFVVLTVIGIWFRGKGMKLTWPWEIGMGGG